MREPLLAALPTVSDVWDGLWDSGNGPVAKVVVIAVIVLVAILVKVIAQGVIRVFVERVVTGAKRRQRVESTQALLASPVAAARTVQRTRTLGSVLNNVVSVVVVVIAMLAIITTLNENLTGAFSLITAALGAGLGFGAQNIIKDVLTGLFMVADDQLGVGDIVQTDLATGIVEGVGIRVTQIRDVNGTLWYVRNGELTRVGNRSQGWSRAIIDVTVPKTADVERLQHRLLDAANRALADPQWQASVLEKPELWGLESITADGIVLRVTVRTSAHLRDDVAWTLRTHLSEELLDAGIQPAAVSSSPLDTFEYAGQLRGVRPPRTSPVPVARRRRVAQPPEAPAQPAARPRAASQPPSATRGATGARGQTGQRAPGASDDADDR